MNYFSLANKHAYKFKQAEGQLPKEFVVNRKHWLSKAMGELKRASEREHLSLQDLSDLIDWFWSGGRGDFSSPNVGGVTQHWLIAKWRNETRKGVG